MHFPHQLLMMLQRMTGHGSEIVISDDEEEEETISVDEVAKRLVEQNTSLTLEHTHMHTHYIGTRSC